MAYAIIPGANGRRHEVDFDGAEVAVEIFFGEDNVEIAVESPHELAPAEKRRLALLNVSRELFNRALADAARRARGERPW